jgi:hypothetical protein
MPHIGQTRACHTLMLVALVGYQTAATLFTQVARRMDEIKEFGATVIFQ